VRGRLKVSIVVVVMALVCAATAPVASAAEAPEETGGAFFALTPRKNTVVIVEIDPRLGVAIVRTGMGEHGPRPHRPSGTVDYAARIPKRPIGGRIDVKIPGVLSIDGDVVGRGEGELEFNGSFHFTGKGHYLSFDLTHATGFSNSGTKATCLDLCGTPKPTLFEYITFPLSYSNHNTDVLSSEGRMDGRVIHLQASHRTHSRASTFKVQALEWLPRHVAVVRTLEAVEKTGVGFKVASKVEHPEWATVRPPAPFHGSAVYRNAGDIRSPVSGTLTGSLSVDLFGVKVPLAGPHAKAALANINPGFSAGVRTYAFYASTSTNALGSQRPARRMRRFIVTGRPASMARPMAKAEAACRRPRRLERRRARALAAAWTPISATPVTTPGL
jgi:hypothetical protein